MMSLFQVALAAATALALSLVWVAGPAAGQSPSPAALHEGDIAPDIELPATQVEAALPESAGAQKLHLKDLRGKKNVVLYFFPKALTSG